MNTTERALLFVLLTALCAVSLRGNTQEEEWVFSQRMHAGEASRVDIDRAIKRLDRGQASEALMQSLGQYGERAEGALPYLQTILDLEDDDWYRRARAARAIDEFGRLAKGAVPRLVEIVQKDGNDCWSAITALGEIQDESAIPHLLDFLEAGKKHSKRVAEALARFPNSILKEYVEVQRSVRAEIKKVIRSEISTREDFRLNMIVDYRGVITLDGNNYTVNFPEYSTERTDIFYVIQVPGGSRFRLNIAPDRPISWAALKLGTRDWASFSAIGRSPKRTWSQVDVPDFEQEGVYKLYLEGRFLDQTDAEAPLDFKTNTVSFEISSRFLSPEEERKQADEIFNQKFPLGPVYVRGAVSKPGRIGLRSEMRMTDAIALAGGFTVFAVSRAVILIRETTEGTEEKVINVDGIVKGEIENPLLQKNDLIFVRTGCIVEGSEVMTPEGPVSIESLQEGDVVISYDPDLGQFSEGRVNEVFSWEVTEYLIINRRLKVTPVHSIYSAGSWINAEDLKVGMKLFDLHETEVPVMEIREESEAVRVYDLSVESPNTFFANGILVHNKI